MAKSSTPLKAEERKVVGRKVKNLRRTGIIPANVFGKKIKSESIQIDLKEFKEVYKHVGETGLVDLTVGKDKIKHVLVHAVQVSPVSDV